MVIISLLSPKRNRPFEISRNKHISSKKKSSRIKPFLTSVFTSAQVVHRIFIQNLIYARNLRRESRARVRSNRLAETIESVTSSLPSQRRDAWATMTFVPKLWRNTARLHGASCYVFLAYPPCTPLFTSVFEVMYEKWGKIIIRNVILKLLLLLF